MRKDGWTDRQTDRHDEANSRFSQFCERTKKGKTVGDTGGIEDLQKIQNP
jgi:hypothetical protein